MKNLKEEIEGKISKYKIDKELIYKTLDMSRQGFDYAIKNNTLKVIDFAKIVKMLAIDLNDFFEMENEFPEIGENKALIDFSDSINDTKTDIQVSEVDFLRSQVEKLTLIIDKLSSSVDTQNINSKIVNN